MKRLLSAVLLVIALVVLAGAGDTTSATPGASEVTHGHPWRGAPGTTVSVAAMMARQRADDRRRGGKPLGTREKPEPRGDQARTKSPSSAPAERVGSASVAPRSNLSPSTSFLGAHKSESGFVPPDSMGSVGPSQVLVAVNGRIKVFDKQGNLGGLDVTDANFWGSEAGGDEVTDPQVEYDRLSQRWFITELSFNCSNNSCSTNNRILVAVSSSSTISNSSSFTLFHFNQNDADPDPVARFADYDQLGVDASAIYVGVNDFSSNGGFTGSTAFVIDKADLLANTLTVTGFDLVSGNHGPDSPQPAQDMDPNVPAGYLVGVDVSSFGRLDVVRISDPAGTPTASSFALTVPATIQPEAVPQASGTPAPPKLDPVSDRLFEAMIGRDESGNVSLWTAHNIEVNSSGVASGSGGRDGARWYQIGSLSTTPTLIQSGTLFDPASTSPRYFWIPSIAMNGQGAASLNSSTAGSGKFASVASSAHLPTDPPGTTEPFTIAYASSSKYDDGSSDNPQRWGDYSQTVVDPTDNQTFWTFQEYANSSGSADAWGVRVIKVLAPPPATPTSSSPNSVSLGQKSVTVQVTGASSNGSGFFDPGPDTGGPGFSSHIWASVSGGVVVNGVTYVDPTHVTLDLDTTGAADGPQAVTITNPDGQSATGQNILVTGSDVTPPDPPILTATVPTSPANDNNPEILGSAEPASTVRLYTNPACAGAPVSTGGAAAFLAPGLTASVPDNSTTTFYATATDISNNTSLCSSSNAANGSITYVEDSTPPGPPETTITKGPKRKTTKRRPKFKFASSEPGSTFLCQIDRQAFQPCASPFRPRKLNPGKHVFRVRSVDAAGHPDPTPAIRKFKVLP